MSQSYSCRSPAESLWASHAESKHPTPPMHQHRRTAGPASVQTRHFQRQAMKGFQLHAPKESQALGGCGENFSDCRHVPEFKSRVAAFWKLKCKSYIEIMISPATKQDLTFEYSTNGYSLDFISSQTAAEILPVSWLLAQWSKRRRYQQ